MYISNNDDVIDSRDIITRIDELEEIKGDWIEEYMEENNLEELEDAYIPEDCSIAEELEELSVLQALADEAEQSPDWNYGETLVHWRYFPEYTRQLCEDIYGFDSNHFPFDQIDWEHASEVLEQDYIDIDFEGETYYIRA